MSTSRFLLTVFTALTIASCSKSSDLAGGQQDHSNQNVRDAYAAFSVTIPNSTATIATASSNPGTVAENAVLTLHVFIYDAKSPYTPTVAKFMVADGTLKQVTPESSKWVTTKAVRTRQGDKYIFAGINLTPEIVDFINSNGFGSFNYMAFEQSTAALANQTNGFVMFNAAYPAVTPAASLSDNEAAANTNHLAISVDRVVAKAAVFEGASFVVNGGGVMTSLKFGWRNLNKKFYFIQDSRDNLIKDHNWSSFSPNDFARGTDAITVYTNGAVASNFSYATENAFQFIPQTSVVNEATFLSISGVFTPDKVITAKVANPASGADFSLENNTNPPGSTFYVVRTTDGIANYFGDASIAQKFATLCQSGAPGMPGITGTYVLSENTYTNGLCYYHVFVNSQAITPQARYNIYRNQYFKVNINSIQAPGNPSDNFDEGEVITPDAWIGVDVEINPWEVIEENHDL